MFSKLAVFLTSVALLAVATPMPGGEAPATECCDTVGSPTDPAIAPTLKSLGITVQDIDALVGLTCSPITVRKRFHIVIVISSLIIDPRSLVSAQMEAAALVPRSPAPITASVSM